MGFGTLMLLYALATGGPPVTVVSQRAVSAQNGSTPTPRRSSPVDGPTSRRPWRPRAVFDAARGSYLELVNQVSGGFFGVDLMAALARASRVRPGWRSTTAPTRSSRST